MFRNYIQIAFRNIRRHPLYGLINISCLAIGIAVCLTIMLYVLYEYSYDRWQRNAGRIFAVSETYKLGGDDITFIQQGALAGPSVKRDDPGVEAYTRTHLLNGDMEFENPLRPGVKVDHSENILFADSNFFEFFSFPLKRGAPGYVLQRSNTVVLSEKVAKLLFGDSDPVGKVLRMNHDQSVEVTGVCADPPMNSCIHFGILISSSSMQYLKDYSGEVSPEHFTFGNCFTWLLLKNPATAPHVTQTLHRLSDLAGTNFKDVDYHLTALPDVHFNKDFSDISNSRYLTIFSLVAVLILLLALVNYMSLSTARAATRAKEVGVRKTMGAGRGKIALQFYVESTLYAVVAFGVGLILFFLVKSWFCNLLQLTIDASFLLTPLMVLFFIGLLLLVVIGAGAYPALVLSAYNPVVVLYGRMSRVNGGASIRKFFTVVQFAISAGLVLCSLVIGRQLHYIRHTDTGVNRELVFSVYLTPVQSHYATFKREVSALPGVRQVANITTGLYRGGSGVYARSLRQQQKFTIGIFAGDNDLVSLLGLRWKYKPVNEHDLYEKHAIVINETALRQLDLPADPLGSRVQLQDTCVVAGVVKDFNFKGLQEKIGPLCFFLLKDTASYWNYGSTMYVKAQPGTNLPTLMERIKKIYAQYGYDQGMPFSYEFLDASFDRLYKAEDRLAALFDVFTGITICIACLGLFALATFSAQQRVREIGIRKVLGASVPSIVSLLSGDFLKPVVLSLVIAAPVAGWAMHIWLEGFAYRTGMRWWLFVLTGGLVLLVAWATVFVQSWRAARVNPAENLRTE